MPCRSARWAPLLFAPALMAAAGAGAAQAGEPSARAQLVYDLVMEKMAGYEQLNEPRVMAICIDWNAKNRFGFFIHNVFITHTDMGTDAQVFIGRLSHNAKQRCKQWRKAEKVDCKCRMLDKNGKNVLKTPSGE